MTPGASRARWSFLFGEGGATPLRYVVDVVVALLCLELYRPYLQTWGSLLPGPEAGPWDWISLFLLLTIMVGIVLRWRFPRTAFAVVLVASFAVPLGGGDQPPVVVGWVFYPLALTADQGLSGLGSLRSRRPVLGAVAMVFAAAVAAVATIAVITLLYGLWIVFRGESFGTAPVVLWTIGTGAMALAASWAAGRTVRVQHLRREETARTEAAEVRTRERLRVAREVHDVVSHSLGAIGMRAGAARYVHRDDPGALWEAMVEIEATSRAATDELRLLLDTLREEGEAPLAPQPGLADLAGIVDTARAAGLECTVSTRGADTLPGSVAVTVFRLVQESVTNAIRHAPGTTCTVTVVGGADTVAVEVADTGPADSSSRPGAPGSGTGQLGMRERVALLGGTFTAGPVRGGGYRVHARIPLDPATRATHTPAPAVARTPGPRAETGQPETSTDTTEEPQ